VTNTKADIPAALEFLRNLKSEERLINLIAINPDVRNDIVGETFERDDVDAMKHWLALHNEQRKWNCYFTVNEVRERIQKKPGRKDIKGMWRLHVDLDPGQVPEGKDPDDWNREERERILGLLTTDLPDGVPEPTCIIDSGGGYWGFWDLQDSFPIDGEEDRYAQAALYNKQLEIVFGADHCHNVDRIARIPGTINWPDKRKREKKGRKPMVASVIQPPVKGKYCYLAQFQMAPEKQGGSRSSSGGRSKKVVINGNVPRVMDVNTELPASVPAVVRVLIAQGKDPDDPIKWSDRSKMVWYVICELIRQNVDDDTIFAIITDPDWPVSAHVIDQGAHYEDYARRQIERAHDNAIDPWLCDLNDNHAVIQDIGGGRCRVLLEREDVFVDREGRTTRRKRIAYQSTSDFTTYYSNKFITVPVGNNTAQLEVGKWWLRQPGRRSYNTVVFSPGGDVDGAFNLWQGFDYNAKPGGSAEMFLSHIKSNLCGGREDLYEYVLDWMATAVQFPDRPGQVAIVLRGKQGTGKGTFAKHFGALWGRHYMQVTNSKHLLGSFNAHLADCVVLFADEAFAAGDKAHESALKSLITEESMVKERKGVDAEVGDNFLHLIVASNEDWVVPTGLQDRRFLVLDVGEGHMQDSGYFTKMRKQMEDGGYESLLHFLLYRDVSTFNVYARPQTEALQAQKILSFSSAEEWWFSKLQKGELLPGTRWPGEVPLTTLAHDFVTHLRLWERSERSSLTRLGMFLARVLPGFRDRRMRLSGKRSVRGMDGELTEELNPYGYSLPGLDECRDQFDKEMGGPYTWEQIIEMKDEAQDELPNDNY